MPINDRLYDFAAEVRIDRDKSVMLFDGEKEFWVPKSLLQDNGDGTFTVPEWKAEELGIV